MVEEGGAGEMTRRWGPRMGPEDATPPLLPDWWADVRSSRSRSVLRAGDASRTRRASTTRRGGTDSPPEEDDEEEEGSETPHPGGGGEEEDRRSSKLLPSEEEEGRRVAAGTDDGDDGTWEERRSTRTEEEHETPPPPAAVGDHPHNRRGVGIPSLGVDDDVRCDRRPLFVSFLCEYTAISI